MPKKAIIIGAGPAGLTAAYELLKRTDIIPIVLEKSGEIGGISRTINYKGNRMDMGPHRFFSKSDRVMNWWLQIMPLEKKASADTKISYQNKSRDIKNIGVGVKTKDPDKVMLVIQRLTRIYFLRRFFSYPIELSFSMLRTLGLLRTIKIIFSFVYIRLFPRKQETTLEDFIINKFGRQLYLLFFKDYTEKVWGVPCHKISAEWGAQRIKGVSLSKAIFQAVKSLKKDKIGAASISQKETETSLIEQFLYPKKGPGALWEEVARQVEEMGGKIFLHQNVEKIHQEDGRITIVSTLNSQTEKTGVWEGDYFFSTMPVQELVAGMQETVPLNVREVAAGLQYRDFINVGILLKQLSTINKKGIYKKLTLKDNWIYIQEKDVKVGRLMIYNNWGDGMIKDLNTVWIGMEYFCNKTDELWTYSNEVMQSLAIMELEKMGLAKREDVLDATVQKMEKTYPAYFGSYNRFDEVKEYINNFENLFLIGRNGMHKYNNADHSMLTAMVAVDNIQANVVCKDNLWSINTEQEYHEEKEKSGPINTISFPKKPKISIPSLGSFIWEETSNRVLILFAVIALVAQILIFKHVYPFANYMPDSYSYLRAAYVNADVNMWPVAYSKFLRLFSVFTHSDTILVVFQYFFLELSSLVFLFTTLYLFNPSKWIKYALYFFLLFNPAALYIGNYISADAIFTGLSLLWLTQLLWILIQPRIHYIFSHAILLLLLFTLRYNAIYYPIISALVFILSRQDWRIKISGIAIGSMLVIFSILYTSNKMRIETGYRQFSAFGGWQLANNALYMYEHIKPQAKDQIPNRFAQLEKMVRKHMDTLSRVKFSHEDSITNYFYLWNGKGPLMGYLDRSWRNDSTTPYFKKWAAEGPLYTDYGWYLIRKYPSAFVYYFLLPNAIKFLTPPTEFLGIYNMGHDSVDRIAKEWFNYKSVKIKNHNQVKIKNSLISFYPVLSALINAYLILSIAGFLILKGFKSATKGLKKSLLIIIILWVFNMSFSVFASPIVLRYQLFSIIFSLSFAMLASDFLFKEETNVVTYEK